MRQTVPSRIVLDCVSYTLSLGLSHRHAPHGRLSHATTRTYAAEIVVALAAVHAQGAVYRDLKANNVVLDGSGRTKLIDFGLAKVRHGRQLPCLLMSPAEFAVHATAHAWNVRAGCMHR